MAESYEGPCRRFRLQTATNGSNDQWSLESFMPTAQPLPEHVQKGLDALESKLAEREAGVLEVKKQINAFCKIFELDPPYGDVETGETRARGGMSFKPDEFADHKFPGTALRQLLEIRGKERGAIAIEEAFRLMKDHGYPFDHRASDERQLSGLRIAIGKDRQLQRHANDTVGLAAWYPNRRKPKGTRADGERGGAGDEAPDDGDDEDEGGESEEASGTLPLALPPGDTTSG